jgi:galactofuranosylgalactofuranosylrhamnosyl-N-acetylglucosaminyl-diphospho-decaprenol beta-1,5/1,6-galactofuranosyltransferase
MDIKRLMLPEKIDTDELLYYRRDEELVLKEGETLRFHKGGTADFNTFFNSFSIGKWKKYTVLESVQLSLTLQGSFTVILKHHVLVKNQPKTKILEEKTILSPEPKSFVFDFGEAKEGGIYSFSLKANARDSRLLGGKYLEEGRMPVNLNINIAVDICTFKREEYVERNMEVLKKDILENPESPLYRHLYVLISDNAKTLDPEKIIGDSPYIQINPNRNVGGVGGFTRGIMEAMKMQSARDISHVLLMDDDAVIAPNSLEVNYVMLSLLKEEYKNYVIAGSIMRLDEPNVQYELGARWNRGKIVAQRHYLDMRSLRSLLENEEEKEASEYTGWWYTCYPLSALDRNNLPLPLFIHRDDVEYGMRIGNGHFIFTNGLCVWHEAFENKMQGPLEYYDLRNMAIVNAIHHPDYGPKEFKKFFFRWVLNNIVRYRYQYVDMNMRAVEDFCKGMDWFIQQEAEPLHQEISAMNYKAQKKEQLIGYKGITEADYDWKKMNDPHQFDAVNKIRKYFQILTLNGYILPAKKDKVLVMPPYNNMYKMYRASEVVYTDASGNSILTKRSVKKMISCFVRLFRMMRYIDAHYDEAKETYAKRYAELTSMSFWRKYLELQ